MKSNTERINRYIKISELITALFFPLAIIYYEIIFKICTGSPFFRAGTIVMLLYSVFIGGILWFVSTLSKKPRTNRIIGAVLLMLLAVIYIVQAFIYKAFKIFYDLETVFGGVGDTLTGFGGDIVKLVFSFGGLIKIIFFFLPGILLLVFGLAFGMCRSVSGKRRISNSGYAIGAYILMLLTILVMPSLKNMQKDEYSFQSAVPNFGLLRSLHLDIISDGDNLEDADFGEIISISDMDIQPAHGTDGEASTENSTNENTESTEVIKPAHITDKNPESASYGYNALDIDFANLKASGNIKKLNDYVAEITPSKKNPYTGIFKGKNLIMISAEAFSAEVIDEELTPTLYRLATKGINFTDYYQPASAGTTGGEYQNVFGLLPMAGGKSFKNTSTQLNYFTMGSQLNRLGYYGKAFHNNTYTYYDRHLTHSKLGYSDGYMGYGNGMEEYVTKRWPQSDFEMISGTLPTYIDKQPFNIYYMSVSGHGEYSRTGNSMTKKNWDRVSHLEYSDSVKGYYAANLELEDALTYLLTELEAKGIADDTVICISSDHFPYGLNDSELAELYGYKASDNFKRDHSRLILWCGELEKYDPIVVSSPAFSLDILPTLSNLFGTEYDSRLMVGRDVFSDTPALVFNTGYEWKTDYGTYVGGKFTPSYPDIELPEDYVKNIKSIVSAKILYCKNAPENDYFRYLFGKG